MMGKGELSFEEQRSLQLDILEEVDNCCRKNHLRYSLAYGTLLGAIRHKGYIPWDDDLDIMMPYDDMVKLRDTLSSSDLFFHDVDTDNSYGNPFGNICSLKTYRKHGKGIERGLGIDVYPVVRLPKSYEEEQRFFATLLCLQKRRERLLRIKSVLFRRLNISCFPGFSKRMKQYRDYLISYNNSVSSRFFIFASPLSQRDESTYNMDLFDELIDVEFEGRSFRAISRYELFLTKSYGDYMQLPPVEERVPHHGQVYFWK